MSFRINVGSGERWLRIVVGVMMIGVGMMMKGTMAGYVVAAMGVVAVLTGMVRWCPMCSIAGRKLPGI